jgi:hypothetical protein
MGEVVSFGDAATKRHQERLAAFGDEVLGFVSWGADEFDLDRPDAMFAVLLECILEVEGAHEAGHELATELLVWFRDRLCDSLDAQAD